MVCTFNSMHIAHTRTHAINIWMYISKETDCYAHCSFYTLILYLSVSVHRSLSFPVCWCVSGSMSITITATIKLECCHKFVVLQFCVCEQKTTGKNFFFKNFRLEHAHFLAFYTTGTKMWSKKTAAAQVTGNSEKRRSKPLNMKRKSIFQWKWNSNFQLLRKSINWTASCREWW